MSAARSLIRQPLLLASLAALLLLISTGLLLLSFLDGSNAANTRLSSQELANTVEQLTTVVSTDSAEWVQSDRLAQLVASADVQVSRLNGLHDGMSAYLTTAAGAASARAVNADWNLLRDGLLSFNQASLNQAESVADSVADSGAESVPVSEDTTDTVQVPRDILPAEVKTLAQDFETIGTSVIQGTRLQSLLDLVNDTSNNWQQINSDNVSDPAFLIAQQKDYADELLLLTGAGTESSLFGYYTSNQIIDYVQQVKNIRLIEQEVSPEASPVKDIVAVNDSAPISKAFVTEALVSLKESVAGLLDNNASEKNNSNLFSWLGLAGLIASLLLLLSAISQMMNAANALKLSENEPLPQQVNRGAMSLREADRLIEDINTIADGDLRRPLKLPDNSHAQAIARSANRSSAVMSDLVGMVRGIAVRLSALVQRHEQHSRVLAELDIRRQTETAELSEEIGVRSVFHDDQRALLSDSGDAIKDLSNRSEAAVNGINQVSASLASVSAQVEVGVERMQRLLKTANSVTEATGELKQLTEKTRLQALNISLKVPQATQNTVSAYSEFDSYDDYTGTDSPNPALTSHVTGVDATTLFDDMHQLTGNLVKISNQADTRIGMLQKDIEDTALALKQSIDQLNESAHHTHSTSLLGKELAGYSDKLRGITEQALQNLDAQQSELSKTAERLVRLDKTGNDVSELTLSLSQDLTGLQELSSKLEESVSGFNIRGEASLE